MDPLSYLDDEIAGCISDSAFVFPPLMSFAQLVTLQRFPSLVQTMKETFHIIIRCSSTAANDGEAFINIIPRPNWI